MAIHKISLITASSPELLALEIQYRMNTLMDENKFAYPAIIDWQIINNPSNYHALIHYTVNWENHKPLNKPSQLTSGLLDSEF